MKTPFALCLLATLAGACLAPASAPPAHQPAPPLADSPPFAQPPGEQPQAPSPSPAPTPRDPSPSSPAEPAPGPLGCGTPASPPPMQCAETDFACWQRATADTRRYQDYRLRCDPVEPRDPIAGERVQAMVGYPPDRGTGECTHRAVEVTPRFTGGMTVFRVELGVTGDCRAGAYGVPSIDLGPLREGRYAVETSYSRYEFSVRPASADPGPLPEAVALAVEVAKHHQPGRCFGMPPGMPYFDHEPFTQTRLYLQMKRAFPGTADAELERLHHVASDISIAPAGPERWTYRYRDGQCCSVSDIEGALVRQPDGSFVVGAPQVVGSTSMPC